MVHNWNARLAESGTQKTALNVRTTETFLETVHETWTDLGYDTRSEFVRDVLRDVVKRSEFDRPDGKAIVAGEIEIRECDAHASEDVKTAFDVE